MNQQSDRTPPRPIFSRSSSRSRTSSFRESVSRYRHWLYFLVGVAILFMVLGIIFVAHRYYQDFGGQGWLKVRDESHNQGQLYADNVFLPLRKADVWNVDKTPCRRSPQNDVPFYECGDQENSCETYRQPNICCPPWTICYEDSITTVGVFCCNASWSQFECQASESYSPRCLASLVECSAETGGGCCPIDDICSPNGCIHIAPASVISASPDATSSASQNSTSGPSVPSTSPSGDTGEGSPITLTNTIIEAPAATYTVVKEGIVAQLPRGSEGSVMSTLFVPYSSGWLLIIVAVLMGVR